MADVWGARAPVFLSILAVTGIVMILIGSLPLQVTPKSITSVPVVYTPSFQPDAQPDERQMAQSVVQIAVPSDSRREPEGKGSGVIVDGERGLVVTNWHVVNDYWTGELNNAGGWAKVYLLSDPEQPPTFTYWAQVLPQYSDRDRDLAILQITHRAADLSPVSRSLGLPAARLGDSARVQTGDRVFLLGFPDYAEGRLAWTEGVVATHDSWWIKTDAAISWGNSGGMMLDEQAELIGIPSQYEDIATGGVTLARPANLARSLIEAAQAAVPALPMPPSPRVSSGSALMVILGADDLSLWEEPHPDIYDSDSKLDELAQGALVEVLREPVWDGARFWYYVQVLGSSTRAGWADGTRLASWQVATSPILFASDRAGSFDIYRILPDGTGLTQLTDDAGDEGYPAWSPNHEWIVFTSNRDGNSDLYVMSATGGPWMQLTGGWPSDLHPAWSPDGSRIAFTSDRDQDGEIFVVNPDGTELRQVTFNDAWDGFPAWSPDGARLLYTSFRAGNYDLFLLDLASGVEQRLTANPYDDVGASWSPHGNDIVYTTMTPEGAALQREIAVLNVNDPAHPRRVASIEPGEAFDDHADWSPDGRWIVFTSTRGGDRDLYLISTASLPDSSYRVIAGESYEDVYLMPSTDEAMANLTSAPLSSDGAPAW